MKEKQRVKEDITDDEIREAVKFLGNLENQYKGGFFTAYCETCKKVHFGGNATPKECFPNLRHLLENHEKTTR